MLNKWFWLELRWAAIVNASAAVVISIISFCWFAPPIIYLFFASKQLLDDGGGVRTILVEIYLIVLSQMFYVFFLYKYYEFKNRYLFYPLWMIATPMAVIVLGDGMAKEIIKTSISLRHTDTSLEIFTGIIVGVIALVLLILNALLLVGVYKDIYLLFSPWLVVNVIILYLLGKQLVIDIFMDMNIGLIDVLLMLFTAYHTYSFIAIFVDFWRRWDKHGNQEKLEEEPNQLYSVATT